MFCKNCGKEIRDGSVFCTECGATQHVTIAPSANGSSNSMPTSQPATQKKPYNTMCILGIVISGISLLLNFWGIVGIAGTIVSVLGLQNCQKKNENGKTLAIIGIVIGVISIVYGVISLMALANLL